MFLEYITQLEAEIANKVSENGDLRSQNRALIDENKRLSDLTRMLLSSPSFSDFLDNLSSNPSQAPQAAPQVEQRETARKARKDVNPYTGQQNVQQQQIGMAIIPEQPMDLSMLNLDGDSGFSFQPQVFTVLDTPEVRIDGVDISILSRKPSRFSSESYDSEEKIEMPIIKHPVEAKVEAAPVATVVDEAFENDPAFALYHDTLAPVASSDSTKPVELSTEAVSDVDIFGGIESEKILARYELVDASEEEIREADNSIVLARVHRIVANMEAICSRLDMLSLDS